MKVAEAAMMMLSIGRGRRHGEGAADHNCDCEKLTELRHRVLQRPQVQNNNPETAKGAD